MGTAASNIIWAYGWYFVSWNSRKEIGSAFSVVSYEMELNHRNLCMIGSNMKPRFPDPIHPGGRCRMTIIWRALPTPGTGHRKNQSSWKVAGGWSHCLSLRMPSGEPLCMHRFAQRPCEFGHSFSSLPFANFSIVYSNPCFYKGLQQ